MKISVTLSLIGILLIGVAENGWTAKVALLIPQDRINAGDDPVNDPAAKEATLQTLQDRGDLGIYWLVQHLEKDLGHKVNLYGTDNDDPSQVVKENDLIFISEAIGSDSVAGDYRESTIPVIFTESYLLDNMGFTNGASAFTGGAMTNEVKIVNSNHPITKGLPPTFFVSTKDPNTGNPYIVTFGTVNDLSILADVGQVLVVIPSSIDEANGDPLPENAPIVMAVEAGTPLDTGDKNSARWVFLGYSDVIPNADYNGDPTTRTLSVLSQPGIQLLDQSIAWALGKTTQVSDWLLY